MLTRNKPKTIIRAFTAAHMIVNEKTTIRDVAKRLGVSRTAIHKYIHTIVKDLYPELYKQTCEILEVNSAEATKRGNMANSLKYKRLREDFDFS